MRYLFITLLLLYFNTANAQSFEAPIDYIDYFNEQFVHIQDLQVEYSSYLVHTRSDVAEIKRQKLLKITKSTLEEFKNLQPYGNDKGLKANAIKALESMVKIGNTNYSALASEKEGCLDCFESVITENDLTDKDSKKLGKHIKAMIKSYENYAKDNDIELREETNSHESLLAKINRINEYIRQLDLATLEVQYADIDIVNALNAKDISTAKSAVKDMKQAAKSASKRLKQLEGIPEDAQTVRQAQRLVEFYEKASKKIYPDMVNAFDKKGKIINDRVDDYNKAIQQLANANAYNIKYQNAKLELQAKHIPKPKGGKVSRT